MSKQAKDKYQPSTQALQDAEDEACAHFARTHSHAKPSFLVRSRISHKPSGATQWAIQQSGNCVYAAITADGPAVYPSLGLLRQAIARDAVEVHEGDREYYEAREWFDVRDPE